MARGFVYLAVVLDLFSRRVLSWRVSITMEAVFCVETLEDALARAAPRRATATPAPLLELSLFFLRENHVPVILISFRNRFLPLAPAITGG